MYAPQYLDLRAFWPLALLAAFAGGGCGGTQSADQALEINLKNAGQTKQAVYPLGGSVTIDGQTPELSDRKDKIVVTLYDPAKPNLQPMLRPHVVVDSKGDFAFNTYVQKDGVQAGKYVVLFDRFRYDKRTGYNGPDGFKNLYNDPDKAAPEFVIDHQSPGKSDYAFDLKIAGRDAASP